MQKMVGRRLLILLTCGFLSCQEPLPEFQPEPNVLAVMQVYKLDTLLPLQRQQMVSVDQTYDIQDTVNFWGVRDAMVRVYSESDTIHFQDSFYEEELEEWVKCTEGSYYGYVTFDDTTLYRLEVILSWEDTVTGEALMPEPIRLIWSEEWEPDTVSISAELRDSHLVTWNTCENVSMYVVYCERSMASQVRPQKVYFPFFTEDTSYALFANRQVWPWDYGEWYTLIVVGITPEYYQYVSSQPPGKSNLSKGYGVFCGITWDSKSICIVE